MIYRNSSLEFGRFLHCGFRNPLAAIWAISWWLVIFFINILIFSANILIFTVNILDFLYEKSWWLFLWKILMIHKIGVSTGVVETCRLGGSFLMVYRNNAGRLGSGFISVWLETRRLDQKSGFYVPERPCSKLTGLSSVKAMANTGFCREWALRPNVSAKHTSDQLGRARANVNDRMMLVRQHSRDSVMS